MMHASQCSIKDGRQWLITGDSTFWHEELIEQFRQHCLHLSDCHLLSLNESCIQDPQMQEKIKQDSQQRTLFGEQLAFLIRLSKAPSQQLVELLEPIIASNSLLMISFKSGRKANPTKTLNRHTLKTVTTDKLSPGLLKRWTQEQLQEHKLHASDEMTELLCTVNQGDPYLIKQDIYQLSLLFPNTVPSLTEIEATLARKIIPSIFNLGELAFTGHYQLASEALDALYQDNQPIVLVLSFIAKMINQLIQLYSPPFDKKAFTSRCQAIGIWHSRQSTYQQSARDIDQLHSYLNLARTLDEHIKQNSTSQHHWQQLRQLLWVIAQDAKRVCRE